MWLATRYGFFSIVCDHGPDGRPSDEWMLVRARQRRHLTALRRFHPGLGKVQRTDTRDYPYRIVARRDVVLLVVARLAVDIDYGNFKDATRDNLPKDHDYVSFLHTVWDRGRRMTPARDRRFPSFLRYAPTL